MRSNYHFTCCAAIGLFMLAACNNSSSPNSALTTKDTAVLSTDHTKNGKDTSSKDNIKPRVPVSDSIRH